MQLGRYYQVVNAKILTVNPPYESFSGLRQEIELDVGSVTMKLYDLIFAIDKTWEGKTVDWKLRQELSGVTGYPLEP